MYTMKCVKYFLYCYLIVSFVIEVGSIRNYPGDKGVIKEEDRRAAEKLENEKAKQSPENPVSLTKKRGLFLSAIQRSPTSLVHPSFAVGYRDKPVAGTEFGYDNPGLSHSLAEGRPLYSSAGSRFGYYPGGAFAGASYPADYGGTYGYGGGGGGLYGHSGGGYEYPGAGGGGGYVHDTEVGHQGGGFKTPSALKGLLLPLAGIALLGAAAALTANPVLLQLGVIGRRRRRGLIQIGNGVYPVNHIVKPGKK